MLGVETKDGLKYINKFDDFAECMEPDVFQALQDFHWEQYYYELENSQLILEELKENLNNLQEEYDSLDAECDSLESLLDSTEDRLNKILEKMYAEQISEDELLSGIEEIRENIHYRF